MMSTEMFKEEKERLKQAYEKTIKDLGEARNKIRKVIEELEEKKPA